jgi:hypothetical protein
VAASIEQRTESDRRRAEALPVLGVAEATRVQSRQRFGRPRLRSHRTTTLPSRRFTKLARVNRRHTTSANLPVTGLTIFHFVIQFREIAPPLLHALVFQMFEIVLRSRCHKQFSGAEVD